MRLQKFLALAGVASRRGAEDLITEGVVSVNGQVVQTLGVVVDPERDRVELRGKRVRAEPAAYRVLLKPRDCLATLEEKKDRPTLARYVPDRDVGWKVVAPLDFHAEGVVLLTTDGALAQKMSRRGGGLAMTYHLKFQGLLGEEALDRLVKGWRWEGRMIRPSAVERLASTGKNTWVEIVVAESRARVLKAAGEALRHPLLKISRTRIGPVSFEGLKMGGFRELGKQEIDALTGAKPAS